MWRIIVFDDLKRLVVGRPIPTFQAHHQKLGMLAGLAVLSADALSSVAYATEEVLRVLAVGGPDALKNGPWIAGLIALLLLIIVSSYRQTIFAYPKGGGDYTVTKENLGRSASLVTAAALLIDYTLTVAVSIAAGVSAITSALPNLHVSRVPLALVFIGLLAMGNLRGVRESARLFGIPVYFFLGSVLMLIVVGAWRGLFGSEPPFSPAEPVAYLGTGTVTTFLMLTAFANGCTAMTGVEAISDGVPAFKDPAARTAARTLTLMGAFAIVMFIGISLLAYHFGIAPATQETVVSQLARAIFGGRNVFYYMVQAATAMILVLAANTAFADFPRLAYFVARDRFMPRQFMNLGDKLAYSNGIVALSLGAGLLIIVFRGDVHALIPLYMIGVFTAFTLSQTGMFLRWRRLRPAGWQFRMLISGLGAVVAAIVLGIVAVTKTLDGAWIVLVLVPLLMFVFHQTRLHYDSVAAQLSLQNVEVDTTPHGHIVIVPIGGVQRAVVEALRYASSLARDVRAVYVNVNAESLEALKRDWPQWGSHVKLVVLQSPYRSMSEPLLDYIDRMEKEHPDDYVTVVLPEFVVKHWWHHLLHNQSALTLKAALLFRPRVVTTSVPFHLKQ
jgi:amino acid transporter